MKIFIVGSGKLATAILYADLSFPSCEVSKWETNCQTFNEKAIIVHAGSGRQLNECLEFCHRTKSVFIELSTGLETEKLVPDFPLVICPNTSILIVKALLMLKASGSYFTNYNVSITESHQSTKRSVPGTAYSFAESLNFSPENIISIRDPEIQQTHIGIPHEYLDKHAYHKIVMKDGDDEIVIETKVLGHNTYVRGVKAIIESVLKDDLENKRYTVLDLISKEML